MTQFTIKQKMSGTGTIHDIASEHYDRVIGFPRGHLYAVVLASYYGGGYTTHRSVEAAARKSHAVGGYSHEIIDLVGLRYIADGTILRRDSNWHEEVKE